MTSTVTTLVVTTSTSNNFDAVSAVAGLVVMLLLAALLLERELFLTWDKAYAARVNGLVFAIIPLVLVFGFIVIMRLLKLM